MHESHQATKYLLISAASRTCSVGKAALRRQAYNGLANVSRQHVTMTANTLSGLRKLVQAIDARYWNDAVNYPQTHASRTPKQDNRSLTLPSLTTSQQRFFTFQAEQQQLGLYPGQGFTSEQKNHTPIFPQTWKRQKANSQERQHCLDNKLCLFCGTSGHVAKDCPKSTQLLQARVSKTDQEKSTSTNLDLKNTEQS